MDVRRSLSIREEARLTRLLLALCAILFLSLPGVAQTGAKPHRKAVMTVEPQYPPVLKNGHFQGQVRIAATVLPNGNVSKVEVKGGNPMLSEFASQAVMKWKYAPGPAETVEEVTFNFNANQ